MNACTSNYKWNSDGSTRELTLLLHSEPLLKNCVLQQEVEETRQGWGIGQFAAQLLLKLQHLLHQVTEKSVIIQKPKGITGNLLLNQSQQASAEFHLHTHTHTGEHQGGIPGKIFRNTSFLTCLTRAVLPWTYPGTEVCLSSFKNRLDLFLHESGVVTHPQQDLGQVPLWLQRRKDFMLCVCVCCPVKSSGDTFPVKVRGNIPTQPPVLLSKRHQMSPL